MCILTMLQSLLQLVLVNKILNAKNSMGYCCFLLGTTITYDIFQLDRKTVLSSQPTISYLEKPNKIFKSYILLQQLIFR